MKLRKFHLIAAPAALLMILFQVAGAANVWNENFVNFNPNSYHQNGNGYWNSDNHFFVLTEPRGYQRMQIYQLASHTMDEFYAEFDLRIGGGSGADGIVFAWVPDFNYAPTQGGNHDFVNTNGYGIEFDCYRNSEFGDPNDQHIALLRSGVNQHLATYAAQAGSIENNQWHHVIVNNDQGSITVT